MNLESLLLLISTIAPGAEHANAAQDVAAAISHVVDDTNPIFGSGDVDRAVLVEMAWQESRFRRDAVGDSHRSKGAYQLQGVPEALAFDVDRATVIAYARIRESAKACPASPLAPYASGSCTNRGGRRISALRMAEALRLVRAATGVAEEAQR